MSDTARGGEPVSLLYLDSYDHDIRDPIPSAAHAMAELIAALPLIGPETLVVVDDSPVIARGIPGGDPAVTGKGRFIAEYAKHNGAECIFSGYQMGWIGMHKRDPAEAFDLPTLVHRARAQSEIGNHYGAQQLYQLVMHLTTPPDSGMARMCRGEACRWFAEESARRGLLGASLDWYRCALVANPTAVPYRLDMVEKALMPAGDLRQAKAELDRALRQDPANPEIYRVLTTVEHGLMNPAASVAAADRQMELAPDNPSAVLDRVIIALDTDDFDTARALLPRVLSTDRRADAWHCQAMIAYCEGEYEHAIALLEGAIEAGCHDPNMAHWHLSLSLHAIGKLREGWIHHEFRRDVRGDPSMAIPPRRFVIPMWEGQTTPARIHVHHEAGHGDNLCLMRYLKLLVDMGHDVRYECLDEMLHLAKRSFPDVTVMRFAIDWPGAHGIPAFDYHLPIGSLPAVFGTDLDTVPDIGPYIVPNPELVEHYRKLVPPGSIGLCWSSGIRKGIGIERFGKGKSMTLETMLRGLKPTMDSPMLISLQVGPERGELADFPWLTDVLPAKPTWDDTAALVACLDAVVTVDTAVAHLAGAMGKPVYLACHSGSASWHWMANVEGASWQHRSPWYPTARVYRQKKRGEWADVIEAIAADLSAR